MVSGASVVQQGSGDGVAEQSLQGAVGGDHSGLVGGDGAVADEFAGIVGAEQHGVGDDDLDLWSASLCCGGSVMGRAVGPGGCEGASGCGSEETRWWRGYRVVGGGTRAVRVRPGFCRVALGLWIAAWRCRCEHRG